MEKVVNWDFGVLKYQVVVILEIFLIYSFFYFFGRVDFFFLNVDCGVVKKYEYGFVVIDRCIFRYSNVNIVIIYCKYFKDLQKFQV